MINEIKKACEIMENGGVILYPTDTIWGLGCDATNPDSVDKIYKIKKRIPQKTLITLVLDIESLKKYVVNVPAITFDLMNSIDKPLTIIYSQGKNLPKNLIAEDGSIAIRIPETEFCQKLLKEFGKPITSSSANISGAPVPLSYSKISDYIKNSVDFIVKSEFDVIGTPKPSTIIKVKDSEDIEIVRN